MRFLSAALLPLFLVAATEAAPRKIVLVAGNLDPGHPKGTHEYEKSVRLLKHCLDRTAALRGCRVEAHFGGWPQPEETLDTADCIVLIASGSDRRLTDHPFLVGDRLQVIGKQMKRGCGLVVIHWSTFFPNGPAGEKALDWLGGHFDYQSGPPPRHWASDIQFATPTVTPAAAGHPALRGLEPFKLHDEFYYRIRFRPDDKRLTPLLVTAMPGQDKPQTVAWAVERADGGRGVGFTGGHFFENWWKPEFRKFVLNAIVWSAHGEVPAQGVEAEPPAPASLEAAPQPEAAGLTLVPGRFGNALDARAAPALVDGSEEFRHPPLTVECWAKLFGKAGYNAIVASDYKTAAGHWELYTRSESGAFCAYLPGAEPTDIVSAAGVCDGQWHYLAMTFDGKTVRLFVDGKAVKEQTVKPRRVPATAAKPGPLMIGLVVGADHRVRCDGLIDDVRISRTLRPIAKAPEAELPLDGQTVGLWRFDRADVPAVDPAWTPRPAAGNAAAWEKETDADWVDSRLREMDTGPTFNATFAYTAPGGPARCYKGTAVKVGAKGEAAVLFDRGQLRLAAGWTGGFLTHSTRRFGLLNTPTPAGPQAFATGSGPGWASPDGKWDGAPPPTAPLPREWGRYGGMRRSGDLTVFMYQVGGTAITEYPWAETLDGQTVFFRNLEVDFPLKPLSMLAAELPGAERSVIDGVPIAARKSQGVWDVIALAGDSVTLDLATGNRVAINIPARESHRFRVMYWHGPAPDLATVVRRLKSLRKLPSPGGASEPGPPRWQPLITKGEVHADNAPYVIDTLTVPYDNPYKALFFITGVDFLPDGDVAVCTAHGDVWVVSGVDAKLEKLTWKRFATGLYQPLGLKVVNGQIVVLERGQLTRLHDLNRDGEADFYECISNDWHTGAGEHSYDTCLEMDPQGKFYFFKTGDTDLPTGGCLMRVAIDGKAEVFATGFRHPIGLGMSPSGLLTGADQEGNWMPATRIDEYRRGGFYGDMRAHHRATPPAIYDLPLCWLPREVDNSAGGQVWVPEGKFGPLSGKPLHLSYGRCKVFLLLREVIDNVSQGGAVDLGLFFLSGVCRGRFRPEDGHLYVVGLRGWQTAARRDGCLQRVRYTGQPVELPVGLEVHGDGLKLTFSRPLDPSSVADLSRWRVEQWNYRWSGDYGSKRWRPSAPDQEGQDALPVEATELSADGRTVFLKVAGLHPVMQSQISYQVRTADGRPVAGSVFHTIHRLGPPAGK